MKHVILRLVVAYCCLLAVVAAAADPAMASVDDTKVIADPLPVGPADPTPAEIIADSAAQRRGLAQSTSQTDIPKGVNGTVHASLLEAQSSAAPGVNFMKHNFALKQNVTHIVRLEFRRRIAPLFDAQGDLVDKKPWNGTEMLRIDNATVPKDPKLEAFLNAKQQGATPGSASGGKDSLQSSPIGVIRLALFGNEVPKTVENFLSLCRGTFGYGYVGSLVHRVHKDFLLQMGDFSSNDGFGGHSIWGKYFDDESFEIKHRPGSVAMANRGKNTNGAQFYLAMTSTSHLDGKSVVFGNILDGYKTTAKAIMHSKVDPLFHPYHPIYISKCSVINFHKFDKSEGSNEKLRRAKEDMEKLSKVASVDEHKELAADIHEEVSHPASRLVSKGPTRWTDMKPHTKAQRDGFYSKSLSLDQFKKSNLPTKHDAAHELRKYVEQIRDVKTKDAKNGMLEKLFKEQGVLPSVLPGWKKVPVETDPNDDTEYSQKHRALNEKLMRHGLKGIPADGAKGAQDYKDIDTLVNKIRDVCGRIPNRDTAADAL